MDKPGFARCIEMLRSADSETYENGYHGLLGHVDYHFDELVQLMLNEVEPDMRSKFVELLGSSKNPKAIRLLEAELKSPHAEVRNWAYSSLCYFDNTEVERLAEKFRRDHPDEEFL